MMITVDDALLALPNPGASMITTAVNPALCGIMRLVIRD